MIKAIIFDLGGVIVKHSEALTEEIVSKMFNASKEALEILQEHRINLSKGTITTQEFLTLLKLSQKSSLSVGELLQQWIDLYSIGAKDIDKDVLELIEVLKKKYNVYLFTDTIAIHDDFNSKRGIYERFHQVFKSHEEGVSKKEGKEAFLHVLNKIQEKPEECIFIDDREGNIKHAEKAGIKGILYTNFENMKEDLNVLGIDSSER